MSRQNVKNQSICSFAFSSRSRGEWGWEIGQAQEHMKSLVLNKDSAHPSVNGHLSLACPWGLAGSFEKHGGPGPNPQTLM